MEFPYNYMVRAAEVFDMHAHNTLIPTLSQFDRSDWAVDAYGSIYLYLDTHEMPETMSIIHSLAQYGIRAVDPVRFEIINALHDGMLCEMDTLEELRSMWEGVWIAHKGRVLNVQNLTNSRIMVPSLREPVSLLVNGMRITVLTMRHDLDAQTDKTMSTATYDLPELGTSYVVDGLNVPMVDGTLIPRGYVFAYLASRPVEKEYMRQIAEQLVDFERREGSSGIDPLLIGNAVSVPLAMRVQSNHQVGSRSRIMLINGADLRATFSRMVENLDAANVQNIAIVTCDPYTRCIASINACVIDELVQVH